ncbi:MAG: hypothetical protein QW063_03000 [Candidatus Nanoarchaeia archaeon]
MESDTELKKTVEVRYEIQLGQLLAIVVISLLLCVGAGFWVGKEVGFAKGFSQVVVEKPDYCTADTSGGQVTVKCNELGNISLESLCKWASPELKEKIRLVLVT